MIQRINNDGFVNRVGGGGRGKQHHISCEDDYNNVLLTLFDYMSIAFS